jgi:thymidylate kinase
MRKKELTLVTGIDGSGKSTFMDNMATEFGLTVLEPTASAEAKLFKLENIDTPLSDELVDKREAIFTGLNAIFDEKIVQLLDSSDIMTSGSLLVTKLSHAVMRRVVGDKDFNVNKVVDEWVGNATLIPNKVVFLHAPTQTIRERIVSRQQKGHIEERFWGFNSPFFLTQYQDALLLASSRLTTTTDLDIHVLDTSLHSPKELLLDYIATSEKF